MCRHGCVCVPTWKMRIGFFSEMLPYLPARDGFRVYAANLLRILARGHQVDAISMARGDEPYPDWIVSHAASATSIPEQDHSLPSKLANLAATYFQGEPSYYRSQIHEFLERGRQERGWDILHVEG